MTQPPMPEPGFSAIAELVVDIAREIQVRAALATPVVPLTQTQGQVMRYIHNHPGCSASDIADGSGLQRANVSTILRELRGRGYITSRRDDLDGRAIRIHATELADETIATLRASWAELIAQAWHGQTDGGPVPGTAIDTLARIRSGLSADRAGKAFPQGTPPAARSGAHSFTGAVAAP